MATLTPRTKGESELLLRGLAILAVVGVHFLAGLPARVYTAPDYQLITVFLDQLSRISVPVFVALSGFGLALKYQKTEFSWKEFLQKRVLKLLPLYIVWSLIFYVVFWWLPEWRPSNTPDSFLLQLLWGKADYQLYFVPMIFQLYLLFPVLKKVFDKQPEVVLGLAGVLQLLLFAYYSQTSGGDQPVSYLQSDQQQYVFAFSWIAYFVLGMYLAKRKSWLEGKNIIGLLALVIAGGALGWAVTRGVAQIQSGVDPIIALRFTRWPILVYASAAVVTLFYYQEKLSQLPDVVRKGLGWMGQHSYGIYLSHTLLLRIFFTLIA